MLASTSTHTLQGCFLQTMPSGALRIRTSCPEAGLVLNKSLHPNLRSRVTPPRKLGQKV